MFSYSRISLVSRRVSGRGDGQTSRTSPPLLCLPAAPALCASPFPEVYSKIPRAQGISHSLCLSHDSRSSNQHQKTAIIVFCDASGADCTLVSITRSCSWCSGIRDSRLDLPRDQTAHPAAQTRTALMKAEALI